MGSQGEGKGAGQPATGDETRQGEERRDAAVAAVSLGAGMRCAGRRHGQGRRTVRVTGAGVCALGVEAGVLGLLADRWWWAGLGRWWARLTENIWVGILLGFFG